MFHARNIISVFEFRGLALNREAPAIELLISWRWLRLTLTLRLIDLGLRSHPPGSAGVAFGDDALEQWRWHLDRRHRWVGLSRRVNVIETLAEFGPLIAWGAGQQDTRGAHHKAGPAAGCDGLRPDCWPDQADQLQGQLGRLLQGGFPADQCFSSGG